MIVENEHVKYKQPKFNFSEEDDLICLDGKLAKDQTTKKVVDEFLSKFNEFDKLVEKNRGDLDQYKHIGDKEKIQQIKEIERKTKHSYDELHKKFVESVVLIDNKWYPKLKESETWSDWYEKNKKAINIGVTALAAIAGIYSWMHSESNEAMIARRIKQEKEFEKSATKHKKFSEFIDDEENPFSDETKRLVKKNDLVLKFKHNPDDSYLNQFSKWWNRGTVLNQLKKGVHPDDVAKDYYNY
jgi:hypothetical protein